MSSCSVQARLPLVPVQIRSCRLCYVPSGVVDPPLELAARSAHRCGKRVGGLPLDLGSSDTHLEHLGEHALGDIEP